MNKYLARGMDFLLVPGMEAMTLKSRNLADQTTFASYTIPRAKRRPLDTHDQNLGSPLAVVPTMVIEVWQEAMDAAVAVSPATLPCPTPKAGDEWVDASGNTWVIVSPGVQMGLFDQRFNTQCQAAA